MSIGTGTVIWKGREIPAILPGLEFSEAGHVYKLNGRQLKSVTQYTGPLVNHEFVQQVDLDWGSVAHDYMHKSDAGILDFNSPEFDHRFDGYIAGWEKFCIDHNFDRKKMLAEYLIFSKTYFYSGRFDQLYETAKYDYLIDIKTGAPSKITGLQLAAYGKASIELELTVPARLKLMEVCIGRDGKCKAQIFDFKTNWQYFLMAYSLQNHLNK